MHSTVCAPLSRSSVAAAVPACREHRAILAKVSKEHHTEWGKASSSKGRAQPSASGATSWSSAPPDPASCCASELESLTEEGDNIGSRVAKGIVS